MTTHVAVCGAGAFGRNHIRVYRELAASGAAIHLAAIVEPHPASVSALSAAGVELRLSAGARAQSSSSAEAAQANDTKSVAVYATTEELLADVARGVLPIDAASVCVPTSAHYAVSAQLLKAGIHVLVEKPITSTIEQADDLILLAHEHHRVLMVGHLERFNPAVQALLPLLRGPMFFEAHRLSVFSPRSLDTDVVLDLMIHDLDVVLQLVVSSVTSVHAVGLPILSSKTDIANVRVEFSSGCVANFTASRVSTERVRKLRFFQPHQYVSVDYARQDLLVIEVQPPHQAASANGTVPEQSAASAVASTPVAVTGEAASVSANAPAQRAIRQEKTAAESAVSAGAALPSLGMHKPQVTPGEPLRLEIEAFLQAIADRSTPAVTGEQARAALALALQIQQAISDHAQHAGLRNFLT